MYGSGGVDVKKKEIQGPNERKKNASPLPGDGDDGARAAPEISRSSWRRDG